MNDYLDAATCAVISAFPTYIWNYTNISILTEQPEDMPLECCPPAVSLTHKLSSSVSIYLAEYRKSLDFLSEWQLMHDSTFPDSTTYPEGAAYLTQNQSPASGL